MTHNKIQIDKTLRQYIHETYSQARLRRNRNGQDRNAALAEILADLEVAGDAMRHLDAKGAVAWKVTPQLQTHLADLQADAEADAEEEAM